MVFRFLLSLFILSSSLVFGSSREPYIDNQEMIVQKLRGLIISGDDFPCPDYVIKTTTGVLFYRINVPKNISDQTNFAKNLERRAIGRPITFSDINQYKKEIANYYLTCCNIHVAVVLPEQDCTNGVVELRVVESKVGTISITGNTHFSDEYYLSKISLGKSSLLDSKQITADLRRINNSPFVKADVVYKAGENPGETDIELVVKDKKPIQFYAGADNTGFKVTQYSRLYIGFNWGNMFNQDQLLAFNYTASPNFEDYQSFVLDYTAPLPNDDALRVFGGYSYTQGEKAVPQPVQNGQSWQLSARYNIHLPQSLRVFQKFNVGLDYKSTNNDLTVGEGVISNSFITIVQAAADYSGGITLGPHRILGTIEGYVQPILMGSSMQQAAYSSLRPNANPYYAYTKGHVQYLFDTGDNKNISAKIRFVGQLSTSALIPVEEFGLGGVQSVRGYVEREVNVDSAMLFNFEIQSPKVSVLQYMNPKWRVVDKLSAVAFLDLGNGWLYTTVASEPAYYFLAGIGPGLRYDISTNLYTKFDLGIRLTDVPFGATFNDRLRFYFSLIANY